MGKTYEALLRAEELFNGKLPQLQLNPLEKKAPVSPARIPNRGSEIQRSRTLIGTPTIFIIDDEGRMCRSLQAILKPAGYNVAYTTSGSIALKNIQNRRIDLFLSDIHMPDLNGFDLLDQVKTMRPEIPIIMMTGEATVDSAVKALKMGAYDFLKKPFEPEVLVKAIENALEKKRLIEQTHVLGNRLGISERRFRFMLQNTSDLIYTLDTSGRFQYVKDSVAKNFGYRPVDLIGRHYHSIVCDDDIPLARWRFNERRTGSRATSRLFIRLKPGPLQTGNLSKGFKYGVELYATGVYRKGESNGDAAQIGTYGVIRKVAPNGHRIKVPTKGLSFDSAMTRAIGEIGRDLNHLLSSTRGLATELSHKLPPGTDYLKNIRAIDTNVRKSQKQARQLLKITNWTKPADPPQEANSRQRRVTFRLKSPTANQVHVAGDFNDWDAQANPLQKDDNGRWKTTLSLPVGRYEFKFMVDGKWREGRENEPTALNRYGSYNNIVEVTKT